MTRVGLDGRQSLVLVRVPVRGEGRGHGQVQVLGHGLQAQAPRERAVQGVVAAVLAPRLEEPAAPSVLARTEPASPTTHTPGGMGCGATLQAGVRRVAGHTGVRAARDGLQAGDGPRARA